MTMTLQDIMERLKGYDEVTLLEVLEINSDMLVERFYDLIENTADKLEEDLNE